MANADDGIRVWVDNDQLFINQWQGQTATPIDPDREPAVARCMVQVEYFDAAADVTIVHWTVM